MTKTFCISFLAGWLAMLAGVQAQPDSLEEIATDFWAWRAKYAPFTGDDVARLLLARDGARPATNHRS